MSLSTPDFPPQDPQENNRIMEPVERVSVEIGSQMGASLKAQRANDDAPLREPFLGRFVLSKGARLLAIAGSCLAALATLVAVSTFAPGSLGLTLGLFAVGFVALYATMRGAFWPGAVSRSDFPWGDAFDTLPEAMFITSRGGRLVFANQAYKDLLTHFGVKRELPLSRVLARDRALGPVLYRLEVSARRGTASREEINLSGPNGLMHHCVVEAKPLKSPTRFVIWSIAEQGAASTEIHSDFVGSIHSMPLAAFMVDASNAIADMNSTARQLLGGREEVDYTNINLDTLFEGLGELPQTDDLATGEIALLNGQACLRAAPLDAVPISLWRQMGEGGFSTVFCLSAVASDGIQSQVAGALEQIMGEAPIAISVVDKEGVISSANTAFEQLANRSNLEGVKLDSLVASDSHNAIRTLSNSEIQTAPGSPVPEIVFGDATPGGDNQARTASAFMAPLGEDGSLIMLAIDITERKKLEMQFHQAQKMQTVGRLAGGIAHDFNNLLTAIIGFCDLLLTRHQVGDPSFADIDQIRQNASRAASLTRQLLAFSRRQNLVPKVLNFTDLLSDAAALLRRMVGEKVELDIVHGRDLARIKADEGQVTQVLTNLVVNAKDAMDGDGKVIITTSMVAAEEVAALGHDFMPEANYVLIEVQDTGSGIPDDVKAQIFEPFFTTKALGEGTGLGLSTVYGIVKQTGGFIFVDSEVGLGTLFSIFLPAYEGNEVAASDEARETEAADNDTTGQGTVLLVEDEAAVRAFSSRALNMRGYTVLEAEDGEDALRVIEEFDGTIDIVVSDVVMPGLDGPGMVEKIRETMPDLKVIFMSGYAEDSFRKQLEEAGGEVHFLPKPFSLPQLAGIVKKVLGDEAEKVDVG